MSPKHSLSPLLIAAAAAMPGLAWAAVNDYSYLEGGLIHRHDYGHSNIGGQVAGSLDLAVPVAPFIEYSSNDRLDQLSIGAVLHAPLGRSVNAFAGASLEHVDTGHGDDTGFGLRGGIRWQATRELELDPGVRYVHAFDRGQTSARLDAAYAIAPRLDLVGAVQAGDDDRVEAGFRYRFGRLF